MIRVWNFFYGCWEWRDYSGNLKYYEGTGEKTQCYSRSAKKLMSKDIEPPEDQEPIPMKTNMPFPVGSDKIVDERPENPSEMQANINFYDVEMEESEHEAGSADDQIRLDQYWARKAAEAERRDGSQYIIDQAHDEAEALLALESGYPPRDGEIKRYHDFEATRDTNDPSLTAEITGPGSLSIAERSQARGHLDAALFLYGYSYAEFIDGMIPDDHIKNISSTLHFEHGETLKYYERVFGIEGCYDSADAHGAFTDFSREPLNEGDLPF
jgi:hypothetical protein